MHISIASQQTSKISFKSYNFNEIEFWQIFSESCNLQ